MFSLHDKKEGSNIFILLLKYKLQKILQVLCGSFHTTKYFHHLLAGSFWYMAMD